MSSLSARAALAATQRTSARSAAPIIAGYMSTRWKPRRWVSCEAPMAEIDLDAITEAWHASPCQSATSWASASRAAAQGGPRREVPARREVIRKTPLKRTTGMHPESPRRVEQRAVYEHIQREVLRRDHYICQAARVWQSIRCGGRNDVHHLVTRARDPKRWLDADILLTVCRQ